MHIVLAATAEETNEDGNGEVRSSSPHSLPIIVALGAWSMTSRSLLGIAESSRMLAMY